MSQQLYNNIMFFSGFYRTIIQIIILFLLWSVIFPAKNRKRVFLLFGALLAINIGAEFVVEHSWFRYIVSAAVILIYVVWNENKAWEKSVFLMFLFYNYHAMSFLMADCVYEYFLYLYPLEPEQIDADVMDKLYLRTGAGQILLLLIYTLCMAAFLLIFRKIGKNIVKMNLADMLFLSVINIVGIIFTYMIVDLLVVKLEQEVYMLFENSPEMLWKIPVMVILLEIGEYTGIFIWKRYRRLLLERQKIHVKEEQLKQMRQRFEEADTFYGDIRKIRHEMKNHMTNIKGLVATEKYDAVEDYIQRLDNTIQKLDYKYSTGNALCDVIINDKYKMAERLDIPMDVCFSYVEDDSIPVFDLGIILNNLLDNAIEACERVEKENRFIHLKLKRKEPFLLIEVENSFDGILIWDKAANLPITDKLQNTVTREIFPEHGLGLKNVKELAEQYLGGIRIEAEEKTFRIIVMLQQK